LAKDADDRKELVACLTKRPRVLVQEGRR
jgi:hypothetical protein